MGRLFRLTVVGVVACVGLAVPRSAGATSGTKITSAPPTVSGFVASPATLGPAGGVVTLSATVTNATTCAFTATKTAAGLTAGACTTGSVSDTVTLPPNTGTHAVTDKFRLTVTGAKTVKSAPIPVTVAAAGPPAPLSVATAIAAGTSHTCAVLTGGTVGCWGYNYYGELGNGTTNTAAPFGVSTPTLAVGPGGVGTLTGATALAAGGDHTCALLSGGTVTCWGDTGSTVPVSVTGLTGVTALAAGGDHTCALLADTTVQCWGGNWDGQLGNGTTTGSTVPVSVTGLTGVTALAAGDQHTCALLADTTVQCWGWNNYGQLGNGTYTGPDTCANGSPCATTPTPVVGPGGIGTLTGVTAIAAGQLHTCAVLTGGTVDCWGANGYGQLGNGGTNFFTTTGTTPTPVVGPGGTGTLTGATALAAGFHHTCALLVSGTVDCWGSNLYGLLGSGSQVGVFPWPIGVHGTHRVPGMLTGVTAIAAGQSHTCAVLTGGTVDCWGTNAYGQLGNGATNFFLNVLLPTEVVGPQATGG